MPAACLFSRAARAREMAAADFGNLLAIDAAVAIPSVAGQNSRYGFPDVVRGAWDWFAGRVRS